MYTALTLLSLLFIALGIFYSAFCGIMLPNGYGGGPLAFLFALLLFAIALILRALRDIETRLIRLEDIARKEKE